MKAVWLFLCAAVSAEAAILGPKVVRDSTLEHHPEVLASIDQIKSAEGAAEGARGALDAKIVGMNEQVPKGYYTRRLWDVYAEKPLQIAQSRVYAGYSHGYSGLFPPQFSTQSTNSGGTPRVGLEFSLLRHRSIDGRRVGIRNSNLDLQIAKGETQLTRLGTARDAEVSYWDWVTARKIRDVYKALLSNGLQREEYLSSRYKRGDASRLLLQENQQYIAARRGQLAQAEEHLVRASQTLSLFWRSSEGRPTIPTDDTEYEDFPADLTTLFPKWDGNIEKVIDRRPDLKNLNFAIEKTINDVKLADQDLMPKFDLAADYTRNLGNQDPTNAPHVWTFFARLEIPIERNLGRGNVAKAKNEQEVLRRRFNYAREQLGTQLHSAYQALRLQLERAEQAGIELARARELVEAETFKFRSGGGTLFLVNLREEAAATAEAGWQEARFHFLATLNEWQALNAEMEGL